MSVLPKAVAYISFAGGGMLVPVRSPYDRQMLVEHIAARVRSKGRVQVLLDEQRWMVHYQRGALRICCSSCGDTAESACYREPDAAAYCVGCALGSMTAIGARYHVRQRDAG